MDLAKWVSDQFNNGRVTDAVYEHIVFSSGDLRDSANNNKLHFDKNFKYITELCSGIIDFYNKNAPTYIEVLFEFTPEGLNYCYEEDAGWTRCLFTWETEAE